MIMIEKYSNKINGVLNAFDRIIFRGHLLSFFRKENRHYFLNHEGVLRKDFSDYAKVLTREIRDHAEEMAGQIGQKVDYLGSPKISKEGRALEIMKERNIQSGLICVLSSLELCKTFFSKLNPKNGKLEIIMDYGKCLYLYFYFLDEEFGFMHVRLQTWFPFEMQIYINGREHIAKKLDESGVKYLRYDNCFLEISDLAKAQEIADRMENRKWCRVLDSFGKKVNPVLKRIEKLYPGYHWSVGQCEYATDIMFKSRETLMGIYPDLVEHATLCFNCEDVMTFLGRKLYCNFQGEIVSDKRRRPQGIRVKHRMKVNFIKMYDKASVLRIETIINDPREFKVYRLVRRRKTDTTEMAWVPMAKKVSNMYRFAQISKASNIRYIDSLASVKDTSEVVQELEGICNAVEKKGRRFSGFNPICQDTSKIFLAILDGRNHINGFSNKIIRQQLYPESEGECARKKKFTGKINRLLRKLRAHGMIAKIPRSFRYKVTKKGIRIMAAALKVKRKQLPELLFAS